jgi:hypothetical protein
MGLKMTNNVVSLFKNSAMPENGPSECDFLSQKDIEFLRYIWNRTDGNMIEFFSPEMNVFRDTLLELGYTDETHAHFRTAIYTPSAMTHAELASILHPVRLFYSLRLEEELKRQISLAENLHHLNQIPRITQEDNSGDFAQTLRASSTEVYYANMITNTLSDIVSKLSLIMDPPESASVHALPLSRQDGPQ